MASTSGPFAPVNGAPIIVTNPLQGGGNVLSASVVVKNISPFLIQVTTGGGAVTALVDPYTTDIVPLDPDAGQEITMTPAVVGLVPLEGVTDAIYTTWYQATETPPGTYPYAMPQGNQQPVGGLSIAYGSVTGSGVDGLLAAPQAGTAYRLQRAAFYFGTTGGSALAILEAETSPSASIITATSFAADAYYAENLDGLLVTEGVEAQLINAVGTDTLTVWLYYDLLAL